ncbi:MAG TPA: sugar phosphate nucleotidyltransferase, partial [Oscillospiraceae bacterium]|nr:sugar phosphate nucleotidyltransferase [Oscillospiraceae bacterium]
YFGDGAAFGIRISYRVEEEPLGTAGGVRACRDFLDDEDFLVISGDGVCSFDLSACAAFHRRKNADATLVLTDHPDPLEYGLVLTGADGRVLRFVEKPAWRQVVTDLVNTGIYFLSPRVLDRVPADRPYDFGRDLFPALLRDGASLYACAAEGYWCDIGDPAAYLACSAAALSRRAGFVPGAPERAPGIWSVDPLPENAALVAPCYLGKNVSVGAGATVGPHTALLDNTAVGEGAMVQRTIAEGASVGARAMLYGAILAPGSVVRRGASLAEGSVLGAKAVVGENASVAENVRVWPGRTVPEGVRQTENLLHAGSFFSLRFGDGGVMRGAYPLEVTPESALALGAALGEKGIVAVAGGKGEAEAALADAVCCGVRAAGGTAVRPDAGGASALGWFVREKRLSSGVFAERRGDALCLRFFGPNGLPPSRVEERRIEGALLRGERSYAPAAAVGRQTRAPGAGRQYVAAAAAAARRDFPGIRPLAVAAEGDDGALESLSAVLRAVGCELLRPGAGIPVFQISHGGLRLDALDEYGEAVPHGRLLALLCMIEFRWGSGTAAVPLDATSLADLAAERFHGTLLRIGRDKGAREQYAAQIHLRDAVFAAARLAACLRSTGVTLHDLDRALPPLYTEVREVPLAGESRAAVMRRLTDALPVTEEGVRLRRGDGVASAVPLSRRAALRIVAEAASAEVAAELCGELEKLIRGPDV